MRVTKNITIEHAQIGLRNFSGKETQFNRAGSRYFCVFFDDHELAMKLKEEGWNIKIARPKDEYDTDPTPYLQVAVAFGKIPPIIMMISSSGKVRVTEDMVDQLDWVEIENVDLIIRPYNYDLGGKQGVKAYLKTMYITIVEDAFASKYRDIPESAQSITMGERRPFDD